MSFFEHRDTNLINTPSATERMEPFDEISSPDKTKLLKSLTARSYVGDYWKKGVAFLSVLVLVCVLLHLVVAVYHLQSQQNVTNQLKSFDVDVIISGLRVEIEDLKALVKVQTEVSTKSIRNVDGMAKTLELMNGKENHLEKLVDQFLIGKWINKTVDSSKTSKLTIFLNHTHQRMDDVESDLKDVLSKIYQLENGKQLGTIEHVDSLILENTDTLDKLKFSVAGILFIEQEY